MNQSRAAGPAMWRRLDHWVRPGILYVTPLKKISYVTDLLIVTVLSNNVASKSVHEELRKKYGKIEEALVHPCACKIWVKRIFVL